MVFSSVPIYLDPPNWQQQQQTNHQQQGGGNSQNNPDQLPAPPLPDVGGGGSNQGSIRPGSMSDRARMAKMPLPEMALKCPRCESTNTKFCYFNNYSLSQPRHFCKTCRRYWTRGGALRSVPVGGGCRRNKRSKGGSSRSKSPAAAGSSSSTVHSSNSCSTSDNIIGHLSHPPPPPPPHQLPFLPSLHQLSDYGSGDMTGLNFGGINQPGDVEFHQHQFGPDRLIVRPNLGINMSSTEHWRSSLLQQQVQQFPNFFANLEPPTNTNGLFQYDQGGEHQNGGQLSTSKPLDSVGTGVATTQMANVKVENNHQSLNLSRNFLGSLGNDHQYWGTNGGGNAWTDLSGFTTSSSTSHLL